MITLALLAGCTEEGSPLGPDAPASFARGGSERAPVVEEEFDSWDMTAWVATDHPLGRGVFESENVSHDPIGGHDGKGALILTLPMNSLDGAEIRSAHRVVFRDVEIRLQTPNAPGTISTFFLYQLVRTRNDRNDEIDIEILNDGSGKILFTTFVRGNPNPTNEAVGQLDFDPSVGFHDYRIEWSPGRVRFLVKEDIEEGAWEQMAVFTTGVPRHAMHVMSSTWWPTWDLLLDPEDNFLPKLPGDHMHEIDRIIY